MIRRIAWSAVALGGLLCLAAPLAAAEAETAKLVASDGAQADNFGKAVSVFGNRVLTGAHRHDHPGTDAGSAYVHDRAGGLWLEESELLAADGAPGAFFGFAVSLFGERALVGAPGAEAAYLFRRRGGTWQQEAKLLPSDGASGDFFGYAVALFGDRLLVGAPFHDGTGPDSGAVYRFDRSRSGWVETGKLTADDAAPGDWFGHSLGLFGRTAAVGAPFQDGAAADGGAVYLFHCRRDGCRQGPKLTDPIPRVGAGLGYSVALSGSDLVAGLPFADAPDIDSGAALVYSRGPHGWDPEARLAAGDGSATDELGFPVAIFAGCAAAGARFNDEVAHDAGAAYVFCRGRGGWSELKKLVASDAQASDQLGFSLSLFWDLAAVGAPLADEASPDAGAVYLYDLHRPMRDDDSDSDDDSD